MDYRILDRNTGLLKYMNLTSLCSVCHILKLRKTTSNNNSGAILRNLNYISFIGSGSLFVCNICGSSYKHASNLANHKQLHTGRTRCKICNKVLANPASLKRHLEYIHEFAGMFSKNKQV